MSIQAFIIRSTRKSLSGDRPAPHLTRKGVSEIGSEDADLETTRMGANAVDDDSLMIYKKNTAAVIEKHGVTMHVYTSADDCP